MSSLALAGALTRAVAQTDNSLTLLSPSACPASGCAAGQTLDLRLNFTVPSSLDSAPANVRACILAPTQWGATALSGATPANPVGLISQAQYSFGSTADCGAPPANYTPIALAYAVFPAGITAESLDFSVRIGSNAQSSSGTFLVQTQFLQSGSWALGSQATLASILSVAPQSNPTVAYVAADAATCGSYSPCLVNSSADGAGGLGTGLKDAIDAATSGGEIWVLGYYPVKANPVVVSQQVVIAGVDNATLTTNSLTCNPDSALLELQRGSTLRNLNITDGSCSGDSNRDLVRVASPEQSRLESNNLTGGRHGVVLTGAGGLLALFNNIQNNSGYAILSSSGGWLSATANNLNANNNGGRQVNCANNGRVDHNFWGMGVATANGSENCTYQDGKRLGAAIAHNSGAPGAAAVLVTAAGTRATAFDNQIAYTASLDTPNGGVGLYIVNHGLVEGAAPFLSPNNGNFSPCSNYWDVFLAEGASPGSSISLAFRYDSVPGCPAVIESNQYCESGSTSKYPLWWYDPATSATSGWNTTGQSPNGSGAGGASGQDTTCQAANNEIQVSIDTSGRPNLGSDLVYSPFVVGVPLLSTFKGTGGVNQTSLEWTTVSEPNVNGFYVMRSTSENGAYDPITDLIARKGTSQSGGTYTHTDTNRVGGSTYYYRIRVVRTDGSSMLSNALAVVATPPTLTPTITPTRTITPIYTYTPVRTATRVVVYPTRTSYPTATSVVYRTATPTITGTILPTRTLAPVEQTATALWISVHGTLTPTPLGAATATAQRTLNPVERTATAIYYATYGTPTPTVTATLTPSPSPTGSGTPAATQSGTPGTVTVSPSVTTSATLGTTTPTATPTPPGGKRKPTTTEIIASVALGALCGFLVMALIGWFLWKNQHKSGPAAPAAGPNTPEAPLDDNYPAPADGWEAVDALPELAEPTEPTPETPDAPEEPTQP